MTIRITEAADLESLPERTVLVSEAQGGVVEVFGSFIWFNGLTADGTHKISGNAPAVEVLDHLGPLIVAWSPPPREVPPSRRRGWRRR